MADFTTPVGLYLKLRDRFPNTILLESSDYNSSENSRTFICCNPIASLKIEQEMVYYQYPDGKTDTKKIDTKHSVDKLMTHFIDTFKSDTLPFKFPTNGLFGYMSYDVARYYDKINIEKKESAFSIPDVLYHIYKNIIVIDHYKNELYILCHVLNQNESSNIDVFEKIIDSKDIPTYTFNRKDDVKYNYSDSEYQELIKKGIEHCQRGDVFQVVLSRRYSQSFVGDEFNVYRALRSINPSPYLFYFDYGDFKLFGSSPEAQLVVKNGKAEIHPIAGTYKRTGDDYEDTRLANLLVTDSKENAEHTMLVDLARNDLSRNGSEVKYEEKKVVQFFSHVIHLVSKVTAKINPNIDLMKIVFDTFPAGTLSGAPKFKAMQLINKYENKNRSFYAGTLGVITFDHQYNHAIIIRSFLSKDYKLYFQGGSGIVINSNVENELQEVNNKLNALKVALELAEEL